MTIKRQTKEQKLTEAMAEVREVWNIRKELLARGKPNDRAVYIAVRAYRMGYRVR